MALNDMTPYSDGAFGDPGSDKYAVAASATLVNAGEPVLRVLGSTGNVVAPLATSTPTSADASHLILGVAASTSTNTASAAGTVQVTRVGQEQTWLIAPKTAATWDTQAEYDALVGSRMTIDLTAGSYTLNATDNAANGCVVEPLDIAKYPGKVRVRFRFPATFFGWATGIS